MYRLIYDDSSSLRKDKKKLIKNIEQTNKIKLYLEQLVENPFDKFLNIKKMNPKQANKFRLMIDNYRIIYSMDFWNKIIIIHRIWLRKDIYKK